MRTLVTGITGYVGGLLAHRLVADGHEVRGFARHPEAAPGRSATIKGDLSSGAGLADALEDIDVAYYLVHSMEGNTDFTTAELAAAKRFARAAADAGVRRIVYMSVLTPDKPVAEYSEHVRSRIAVEEALAAHGVPVVVLRASIVIGAGSRSFRFLLRLVQRLPVLLLPPWREHRTMPIDERDLLNALVRAATAPIDRPVTVFDAVGPDEVSYQGLIEAIRDSLMVGRPTFPFPFTVTALTAPVAAAVAGEDLGLVQPLMSSLDNDLLPRSGPPEVDLGTPRHGLVASIDRALRLSNIDSEDD